MRMLTRLDDIRSISHAARELRPDVLVVMTAHGWPTLLRDIPLLHILRPSCRRVVLQFHGSRSSLLINPGRTPFKTATRRLVFMADLVLLLSGDERNEWIAFEPRAHYAVVANPFVPKVEETDAAVECIGGHSGALVILFVGRLTREKGVFDLLSAFQGVHLQQPCKLVLTGSGQAAPELRKQVTSLGLGSAVEMTGYVEPSKMLTLYRSADVFVLPSYAEGFPTVLAEAMHAGLPIVTTGIRGAAEHLTDGENALFVQPGHPEQIEAALLRLLLDPALRARMGHANRERVQRFAPDRVASEYARLLADLL